jgi:hypothetical protein
MSSSREQIESESFDPDPEDFPLGYFGQGPGDFEPEGWEPEDLELEGWEPEDLEPDGLEPDWFVMMTGLCAGLIRLESQSKLSILVSVFRTAPETPQRRSCLDQIPRMG